MKGLVIIILIIFSLVGCTNSPEVDKNDKTKQKEEAVMEVEREFIYITSEEIMELLETKKDPMFIVFVQEDSHCLDYCQNYMDEIDKMKNVSAFDFYVHKMTYENSSDFGSNQDEYSKHFFLDIVPSGGSFPMIYYFDDGSIKKAFIGNLELSYEQFLSLFERDGSLKDLSDKEPPIFSDVQEEYTFSYNDFTYSNEWREELPVLDDVDGEIYFFYMVYR